MTSVERIRANNVELQECLALARNIVSGGDSIKLYKFNDIIDENGSFEHQSGTMFEIPEAELKTGMEVKNVSFYMEGIDDNGDPIRFDVVDESGFLYPTYFGSSFDILFYGEIDGEVDLFPVYTRMGEPLFVAKNLTFEIVNYGKYESWFKANISPVGGGECTREHVIEVTELPTDNIDKTAVYALKNTQFAKITVCQDGIVIPDYMDLITTDFEIPLYYVMERPTENIAEGLYYCHSEKDIFFYIESEGGWGSFSVVLEGLTFQGAIENVDQVTEDGYYAFIADKISYHRYRDKYFKDIVIFDEEEGLYTLSEAYDGTGLNISIGYSIVPTTPTENIVLSTILNYELFIFHFYYIEDANEGKGDILLYFQGGWTRAEELFGTINGIVKDISEITEEGVYAVLPEGFENYILPEGSIIAEEPGRYNVALYDSVIVKSQPKEISGVWRFNDDVASFGSTQQVNFTTFHKGEVVKCVAIETELDDFGPQMSYHLEDGTVLWNLYDGGWGTYTGTYSSVMMTERIIDFGKEEQKVPGAFKEWLLANAMPYEKSENLYVRNLYELPEDADDGVVAFVLN